MKKIAAALVATAALVTCSVALAAGAPHGKYVTRIHSTADHGQLNGTWTLDFKAGKYTVSDDGHLLVHGTYRIHGDRMTVSNGHGPGACSNKAPATYTFTVRGSKLRFTKDSGPKQCVGRDEVLSRTFTRER